jgi:CHAT domain-containing protein
LLERGCSQKQPTEGAASEPDLRANMQLDSRILVLIVIPDADPKEATLLQGFAPSLCENSWIVGAAASVPSSIIDLTPEGQEVLLARRMSGANPINWFGQTPRALKAQRISEREPFVLVMLPPEVDPAEYVEWAQKSVVPPTIIAERGGDLTFSQLTTEELGNRFLHVCDQIPKSVGERLIEEARQAIRSWVSPQLRPLGYQVGGHNSIAPNIRVLESAGFTEMVYGRFNQVGQGLEPYVNQIVRTTDSVLDIRESVVGRAIQQILPETMDLNLFAPAVFPFVFKVHPPADMLKSERDKFVLARRLLERQTGYGFISQTPAQVEALMGDLSQVRKTGTVAPHPLFQIRQQELNLATECMSALAVSEVSAVVRLPNDANRVSGAVRNFAAACRSATPSPRKRLRTFREVQEYLRRAVPQEFLPLIRRSRTGIRIVADAHLEWLDVDGLPLCIRNNVTRIPVTPGSLFVQMTAAHPPLVLTVDDFRDILVIDALDRSDEIRRAFDIALGAFESSWRETLRISFAEVSSSDQLATVLNNFEGQIVVFDGHGGHERDDTAKLFLKGIPVDVWELKEAVRKVPPIVILSACDTHAADRNHATTANGFLSLGVLSVLASVFPLPAVDAATFVARLLFRIAAYLPIAADVLHRAISWNEVVSGMLRMQLLTDYLRHLLHTGLIDEAAYVEVHKFGNGAINGGEEGPPSPEPFAVVDRMLIQKFGIEENQLRPAFEIAVANSSVLNYLQLGRPETISITSVDTLEELRAYLNAPREPEDPRHKN